MNTNLLNDFLNALIAADEKEIAKMLDINPALSTVVFDKNLSTNPPIFIAVRVPNYDGHGESIPCEHSKDIIRSRIVQLLIDSGADPNYKYKRGVRPLHMAARYGQAKCIDVLAKSGANIDVCDINGETPLFRAANLGHKEAVGILLKIGANPNLKNKKGFFPIDKANKKGYNEIVKLLSK